MFLLHSENLKIVKSFITCITTIADMSRYFSEIRQNIFFREYGKKAFYLSSNQNIYAITLMKKYFDIPRVF